MLYARMIEGVLISARLAKRQTREEADKKWISTVFAQIRVFKDWYSEKSGQGYCKRLQNEKAETEPTSDKGRHEIRAQIESYEAGNEEMISKRQ